MKILFDQGTPNPLRHALTAHTVSTAAEMGWSQLENGRLLDAAERAFDVFVTTDQNIRYQQNLAARTLAILVLTTTSWPTIRSDLAKIVSVLDELKPGEYREVSF